MKLCLVGSSGGHLTQLYMLKPFWKDKDHFWVTFDKEDARSLLEGEKMYPCYYPTNRSQSSPNLCVNSSFSYVVLPTLLLSSRDLTEWSLVYHNTLSYQRFYDLHSIHYDHLEGLHQLI